MNNSDRKTPDELHTERTIKTYSGHYIDVFNPDPDTIDVRDIAHALSLTARWGGHTRSFYSVGSHSIWVATNLPDEFKLEGLLHDATEAYIGDMPKPIKRHLPDFNKLENNLDRAIRSKFGLPLEMSPEVKKVDWEALEYEWANIKHNDEWVNPKTNKGVEELFIDLFHSLNKTHGKT